jgi:hypothetical protein
MRRTALLILAALAAAAPVSAEQQRLPPRPYTPVAILPVPAPADTSLDAFRGELAAVAEGRVYAELARLVAPQGFFWDRDFGPAFDPRKPAVDNLAAAIRLEHRDGVGWRQLAGFAAEAAVEELVSRPGIVCAPAPPRYDVVAFARLLDETYTFAIDWAYPLAAQLPVRAAPRPDGAVVGTLGRHFVRLMGLAGADGESNVRDRWARIATPAGDTGFVAPGSLSTMTAARLCYGKDTLGRWRIAGYIAGDPPTDKPQH